MTNSTAAAAAVETPALARARVVAKSDAEENGTYKKTIEDGLREWINTLACRRDVADKYFDNPTPRKRQSFQVMGT